MASNRYVSFSPQCLRFLAELSDNNNREWFAENKRRYEADVLDAALRFIDSMQEPLAGIAPRFTAVPRRVGGSLMRVYRDTRFSKNNTPYKTNVGIQFRHEQAKSVHAPGFYVHVDPERAFLGVGLWRPPADALAAIRQRIDGHPAAWKRILADRRFRRHFELAGESLQRPPRGYGKEHPLIDDLRRKDFIAVKNLEPDAACDPKFQKTVEAAFAAAAPFMQFLCKAVGVPY